MGRAADRGHNQDRRIAEVQALSALTERHYQSLLWRLRHGGSRCAAPNYTPKGWWECDLWTVTRAGYAEEFEIKRTVQDFKADLGKTRREFRFALRKSEDLNKHGQLFAADPAGPSRFWYVVPDTILEEVRALLPAYAGLWKVSVSIDESGGKRWFRLMQVKQAPRLHTVKVSEDEILKCRERIWYRYMNGLLRARPS